MVHMANFFYYYINGLNEWLDNKLCILNLLVIDVLPSKNQALCEYCIHVNQLKHC